MSLQCGAVAESLCEKGNYLSTWTWVCLGPPLDGQAWNTSSGRQPGGILTRYLNHLHWFLSMQGSGGSLWKPSYLYPQSCPFGRDPSFMTIGEGRNKDLLVLVDQDLCLLTQLSYCHSVAVNQLPNCSHCCNSLVSLLLRSPLTREQDPEILELLYLG